MKFTSSYLIFLALMSLQGFTCAHAHITFNKWEYWVLLLIPIAAYLCGYFAA